MRARLSIVLVLSVAAFGAPDAFAQSPYYNRDRGFGVGALLGALTGGAIGHNNGQTAEGALIGGAVGALAGAAMGDSVDADVARTKAAYEQQLAQQASQAVTVADAISMTQSRLSDNVIATHIRTYGVVARPKANDLILMSQAGVSDTVIHAMQSAPVAGAGVAVAPPTSSVIVREHYYAPPVYLAPVAPHWHCPPYRPYPMHAHPHSAGIRWGISFGD